MTLIYLTATF